MTSDKSSTANRNAQLMRGVAAYADEKAAADQAAADERAAGTPAGSVNFSVRLPTDIAVQMRKAAHQEQSPTSAWLRRIIVSALQERPTVITDRRIEQVVRRVLAENAPHAA